MRVAFLILLLANLLLYVWSAGYLGGAPAGREPERLAAQLNADKLQLAAPSPVRLCRQIEGLDGGHLAALRKLVADQAELELSSTENRLPGSYWLGIPVLESKEAAERKQAEVSKLGIKDSSLHEDSRYGPWLVVLGNFSDSTAAQKMLDELAPRGLRSARVLARENGPVRHVARLRWPESLSPPPLPVLQQWLGEIAGERTAELAPRLQDCPAK